MRAPQVCGQAAVVGAGRWMSKGRRWPAPLFIGGCADARALTLPAPPGAPGAAAQGAMMPTSPTPAIEIAGVAKRYGDQTELGLDLTVPAGTVTALLAPTGRQDHHRLDPEQA